MTVVVSRSAAQTKKTAAVFAKELSKANRNFKKGAAVVALEGNLGSGKTTFVRGFARARAVRESVLSPTFVLMKIYPLQKNTKHKTQSTKFRYLIHIDCYRLNSPKYIIHLGFKDLVKDQDAIILIEWADRIKKVIPKNALWFKFSHGKSPLMRTISMR